MQSKFRVSKDKLHFREVWIGGLSKEELIQKLKDENIHINEFGLQIINHKDFTISPFRKKLKTVEISVNDLGFPNGAITEELYQKADKFGLKLCPPEVGPHLRLQFIDLHQPIDSPKDNWQIIAMKVLSPDPNFPKGFYLRRKEDGFWLRGYRSSHDYVWDRNDHFIFLYTK